MKLYQKIENEIPIGDIYALRQAVGSICYTSRDFSSSDFDEAVAYFSSKVPGFMDDHLDGELVSDGKSSFVKSDFTKAVFMLKENFCKERIEDVKKIGKAVYGNSSHSISSNVNSSHSISSNVSKQKLIINLIQKVANKIKDLLQKAIVSFKQALAKNSQFIKKYNDSLIKNSDAVNNIEVEWIDIDELFSINNQFQVIAKPSYEDKINDAVQKSDVQEYLSYLKGYKPKKITIKISDSRIGGIKNLLSMFDKLRFGNTGCWNVDEWRKKMNRASNVIADKKSNASDSEIKDSLLCQCYYLYARAMVNAQSSLLVSCKNALTKAIGVTYNIKESTINAAMQAHQNEASTVLNNIFIEVELPSMINEFNYFIKPLFNNTIISEGDNMAIKYLATTNNGYGSYDEFNAFMESNFGLNEGTATDYKTIDISDCDGVDITDTISGNFDNWEGIIPDNTIGDITAEFDDFLESTFDSMDFDNDNAINEQFDQMIGRVMLESDSSSKISKLKSELEKTCVGKTEHQIDAILYKYYKLCRGKAVAAIIGGSASAGAVVGAIAGGITAGGAGAASGAVGGAMFGGIAGCYVYIFIASYYIGKLNKFNIPLLKKRRRIEKIIYDTEDLLEKARDKNKTKEAKELESLLRKERRELDRLQRITSDKVQKVNSAGAYSESTGLPNITAEFDAYMDQLLPHPSFN